VVDTPSCTKEAVKRGKLITVESIDGAGKGTLVAGLQRHLESQGIDLVVTREPGGTPLGEAVRAIMLDPGMGKLCDETELLLMFATRAQVVRDVIEPALAAGKWVLADRFTDASYAYQGGGRGIPKDRIDWLVQFAAPRLVPDLTLLLDVPVETGRARTAGRGGADRIESEADTFFHRVRSKYRDMAAAEPQRFRVIDASHSVERVLADAIAAVTKSIETIPTLKLRTAEECNVVHGRS